MPDTWDKLLRQASAQLAKISPSARLDAELLLAAALDRPRSWLRAFGDEPARDPAARRFRALLAERARGVPVAHLLGQREFWSLPLRVSADTLIPRPETELLVERALLRVPASGNPVLLDLGTGSGAIALALAGERPAARVTAVDRSRAALAIARENATRLARDNLEFLPSDWFAALAGRRYALIVSNPPYIAGDDPHLQQGDVRFEPRGALVAGADGLDDLRRIIAGAPDHLQPGGWLLVEHGNRQGPAVRTLFTQAGFRAVVTYTDLAGHERITEGQCPHDPSTRQS